MIVMKKLKGKRWLAAVCAAMMTAAGTLSVRAAGGGPQLIVDTAAGETAAQATSEEAPVWAAADEAVPTDASSLVIGGKSAMLIELSSGQVLFEKNPHEKLPIASVA